MNDLTRTVIEFVALRHPYGVTTNEIIGPGLSREQLEAVADAGYVERLPAPNAYLWVLTPASRFLARFWGALPHEGVLS